MDYQKVTEKLLEHDPKRSEPFLQGMAAVLQNRVDRTPVTSPYSVGSVEDDAFFSGRMRAHNEFRNLLQETQSDHAAAVARMRQLAEMRRTA
ncbi:MAG: hypothetical protein U5M72_06785 [Pseudomonas sp.]|nr:hypothetical protein [Pseudomonas sp.]